MSTKKSFVLRLDEDVYKTLEKWASDEFRSVNGQMEWLINKALKDAGRKVVTNKKSSKDKTEDSE